HQIDGVAAFDELHHLVEDAPVRVAEEIRRVDHLGGEVERVVVQENRAEHGALGLEIVRKGTFGNGDVWHALDRCRRRRKVYSKRKKPERKNTLRPCVACVLCLASFVFGLLSLCLRSTSPSPARLRQSPELSRSLSHRDGA